MIALLLLFQDDKLWKELDYANDADRPMYQEQAVRRLKARGEAATPAILEWTEKRGRKKLAIFFVESLAEFRDERISKLLADLAADRAFDWRAAATASLAAHGRGSDRELFRKLLADPIWGVRIGAILGLERLKDRESIPAIRRHLEDDLYEVRARAAKSLHALGDSSGIPMLVESLSLESTWFEIDYGRLAREDALEFLRGLAGEDFGYKPWESREERAAAVSRWHQWMDRRDPAWRENVPKQAKLRSKEVEYTFGYELRCCQLGDFFLRLDVDGNLVLGRSNLEVRKLTDDQRARLRRAIDKIRTLDRGRPYGRGGCDYEQYYLRNEEGGFDKLWVGREGRPAAVDLFPRTVGEILREMFGDALAHDFHEKTDLFRDSE